MSAGQVILSADDYSPQCGLGQVHVNFDLEGLLGPRSYLYVRNHETSAWTKGLAVRQRTDLFSTEGTAGSSDTNTSTVKLVDAGAGAPFTTEGYVPDTLKMILYWHTSNTPSANYAGRVWRTGYPSSVPTFYLKDPSAAAMTNSGSYIAWLPYAFITQAVNTALLTGGITQSAISAGYYGWVQFGGFGYLYAAGSAVTGQTDVANGCGIIPSVTGSGATAGYGHGVTDADSSAKTYAYAMVDNTSTALYIPAMISCPATAGLCAA